MIIWLHTTLKSLSQHFSNKAKKLTFGVVDKECIVIYIYVLNSARVNTVNIGSIFK
jgi:hypothetical protein